MKINALMLLKNFERKKKRAMYKTILLSFSFKVKQILSDQQRHGKKVDLDSALQRYKYAQIFGFVPRSQH